MHAVKIKPNFAYRSFTFLCKCKRIKYKSKPCSCLNFFTYTCLREINGSEKNKTLKPPMKQPPLPFPHKKRLTGSVFGL